MKFSNISSLIAVAVGVGTFSVPVHAGDSKCTKGDYGCGKGKGTQPYWTDTCSANACCCKQTDLDGYRHDACTFYDTSEHQPKGCMSCLGKNSCYKVSPGVKIGDRSCVNEGSCNGMDKTEGLCGTSIVWNHSCRAIGACNQALRVVIGPDSCGIGEYHKYACNHMSDSTVGAGSCQEKRSCDCESDDNNDFYKYNSLTIGGNSCNLEKVCYRCASGSTIPNNACNTEGGIDVSEKTDSYGNFLRWQCKYCVANNNMATVSASYTSTRRRLESAGDLEMDCKALALALLDYTDRSIEEYSAFRQLISGDACNGKYKNVFEFTADSSTGICSINLKQLWTSRPTIGDEPTGKEYIAQRILEFKALPPILEGFTLTSLAATDEEFECESDVSIKSIKSGESGKSGKIAPAQAQTIDDGGSKSDLRVEVARKSPGGRGIGEGSLVCSRIDTSCE